MPGFYSVTDAVCTLFIVNIAYLEHRRSVRPSALFTLLLVVSFLGGIERKQLSLLAFEPCWESFLAAAAVALKLTMIELQDRPKKHLLVDKNMRLNMGDDAGGGLFRGLLSFSLNPVVASGYRSRVFMSSPSQVDPNLHPVLLLRQLKKWWVIQQVPSPARPGDLLVACLKAWKPILQPLLLSRLTLTALKCSHPFVLRQVIETIDKQYDDVKSTPEPYVTFCCAVVVFLGTAFVQEHFSQLMACYTARLRGGLIAIQLDKLQRLTEADAKRSGSSALISSDIDGIIENIPNFLLIPISIFEIGVGSSLLSWFIDAPVSIVCLPVILSSLLCYLLAQNMVKHVATWNESISRRVSSASRIIQQLTAIKMLGLGPTLCEFLQHLQTAETQLSKPLGVFAATISILTTIADFGVPAAAVGVAISANFFNGRMSAAKVFPLLSIIFSIHTSFPHIINSMSTMMSLVPCFTRIQDFLCLAERKDCRIAQGSPMAIDLAPDSEDVICFNHANISPHRTVMPAILREVNFRLARGSVTGVIGPHGAGKSTFMRAILGDSEVTAGSVQVNETEIGYCGEEVWLRQATVRDNIIGVLPYDAQRYTAAIRACFLEEDLEKLPGGDHYVVGAHGSNLSDGQRQRIGIARALYAQHHVTLLDDVFRSLDIETAICILHQLCGKNSILRQAGCTVVVVTSLPQCLEVVDQLVFLDGLGEATLDRSYLNPPHRQKVTTALRTLNINNNALLVVEKKQQSGIYRYLKANGMPSVNGSGQKQRISDWELVLFALKPVGKLKAILQASLTLILAASEVIPHIYLRFWVDFHPEDPSLYTRYLSLSLLTSVVAFITNFSTMVLLSPRVSAVLHETLVKTLVQSTLSFFELAHVGKLLGLFSDDTYLISRDLPRATLMIVYAGSKFVVMVLIILSGNNYSAVAFPGILIWVLFHTRHYRSSWRDAQQLDARRKTSLCIFFEETSASLTHSDFFYRREQRMKDGMSILLDSQVSFYRKCVTKKQLRLSVDLLGTVMVAILLAPALFLKGISTATSVGLAYYTVMSLSAVLYDAVMASGNLNTALEAVWRLDELQQRAPSENVGSVEPPVHWPASGAVDLHNVSVYYTPANDAAEAVSNVSLSISPGHRIGITGRSGSGKSSLVLALLGFVRYEGTCQIDGIEISSIVPKTLRSRLITIPQEPIIFEGTVRKNMLPFALNDAEERWDPLEKGQKDAELEQLLKQLHIWMPLVNKGRLDAIADDVGYSKGDLQLLCIGRAILRQRETGRKVVLVDDATSYLGMAKEKIANDVMRESFDGCTVLRISVRQSGLVGATSVVHFRRGAIVDPNQDENDSESDEAG